MDAILSWPWALPVAGLLVGVVMGHVARTQHFCTMSALERCWYADDWTGARSWVTAGAVALIATQILAALGLAAIGQSFYITEPLSILGSVVGGLMFGVGMALVGTCGFGAIIRLGGGNLRALVVLTGIALAAIAAQRGLTGLLRVNAVELTAIDLTARGGQSLPELIRPILGFDSSLLLALVLGGAALVWAFKDAQFRKTRGKAVAGIVIGLCITAGWLVTTFFSQRLFEPVQIEAGSFVMPAGDAMLLMITATGALPDYGVGLVAGVLLGASIAAMRSNDMRWEACDDARELSRHLVGAFLMGTGGVFALGCTIGQGVSAISVLSISAPLTMASMVLGARFGIGYLIEGDAFGFLRSDNRVHPA